MSRAVVKLNMTSFDEEWPDDDSDIYVLYNEYPILVFGHIKDNKFYWDNLHWTDVEDFTDQVFWCYSTEIETIT